MSEGVDGPAEAPPESVGARLAAARIANDLSIDDIASRTRIPRRHLEALERGDALGMAGTTYTIGFAKSYARAVNLDAGEIGRDLRAELGGADDGRRHMIDVESADPSRVPPRMLVLVVVVLALLVAGGYGLWRSGAFGDDAELRARLAAGTLDEPAPIDSAGGVAPAPAAPAPPAPPAGGPVAITATEPVWVRIYEAKGTTLFQGEMKVGQRYDVPATATDPQIRTGRPQSLRVTVGQAVMPPLGPADRVVRDVSLKAASLTERAAAQPAPASPPPVPNPAARP